MGFSLLHSNYFSETRNQNCNTFAEGSGFEDERDRLQGIDRQTLMVALADLDYVLVRATHDEAADVIG